MDGWDISGYPYGISAIWSYRVGISQDMDILDMGSVQYGHAGISWDTSGYLGHFGHGNSAIQVCSDILGYLRIFIVTGAFWTWDPCNMVM